MVNCREIGRPEAVGTITLCAVLNKRRPLDAVVRECQVLRISRYQWSEEGSDATGHRTWRFVSWYCDNVSNFSTSCKVNFTPCNPVHVQVWTTYMYLLTK